MTRRLTVVTCNDDWATPKSNMPWILQTAAPTLWGSQESKGLDYRDMLDHRWGIRQRMADQSTQGVAVGWDRRWAKPIGEHHDEPDKLGSGWQKIVDGSDLLARGVVWQDVEIDLGPGLVTRLRIASFHRPPARDSHLWPVADVRLVRWLSQSPLSVVLCMDSNQHAGPRGVTDKLSRMKWAGHRIDGVLLDRRLIRVMVSDLPQGSSDHHPVRVVFLVPIGLTAPRR